MSRIDHESSEGSSRHRAVGSIPRTLWRSQSNPGFETGTLQGWTVGIGGAAVTVQSAVKHSGSYALKLAMMVDFGTQTFSQGVSALYSSDFTLSFWFLGGGVNFVLSTGNAVNPNFHITQGASLASVTYTTSQGVVLPTVFFPVIPSSTWAQITVSRTSGNVGFSVILADGTVLANNPALFGSDASFTTTGVNIFDESPNGNVEYFDDFSISGTV